MSTLPFGFTSLALLALAPVTIAALVYAYRRRGRGTERVVSSLLLLRLLERKSDARRQFHPPPRFFFELLLLLLLVLAAAGIYLRQPPLSVALLLDNSISTAARSSEQVQVIDRIRDQASAYLASLPSHAQVTVFTTTPQLERHIEAGTVLDAQSVVRQVLPAFGSDALERMVPQVLRDSSFDALRVFSDRPVQRERGDTAVSAHGGMPLDAIDVLLGESLENVAISGVRLSAVEGTIEVDLASYARADVSLTLVLEQASILGSQLQIAPLAKQPLKLPAGEARAHQFHEVPAAPAYRVRLEFGAPTEAAVRNTLREDDTAWITSTRKGSEVLLVSALTPRELGLDELTFLTFRPMSFEQADQVAWQDESALTALEASAIVFHRYAPPELPLRSALYVLPGNQGPFRTFDEVRGALLSRWEPHHSLTAYLNLAALQLPRAFPLRGPSWSEEVIVSTSGPLLLAGEVQGRRYAGLGFELFPFAGRREPITSVLTLNLLRWISGGTTITSYHELGRPLSLPPGTKRVQLLGANEAALELSAEQLQLDIPAPGLVAIHDASDTVQLVAANLLRPEESNTLTRAPYSLPHWKDRAASSPLSAPNDEQWVWYLVVCVALLWGLDALARAARRMRGRRYDAAH